MSKKKSLLIVVSIICFSFILNGAIIPVGSGSYTTTLPGGTTPPHNQNGQTVYPAVTGNVTAPIPTTDWWTSLVYKNNPGNQFSETLAAHPMMLKCEAEGLGIGTTPDPAWNPGYVYSYTEDIVVGVLGMSSSNTFLDGYGDWTVTAKWENGGNSLLATFGHGLPFTYFTKTGSNAELDFVSSPTVWYNTNGVLGVTINGNHYGIFAPTGSTWSIAGDILQSNLNGNDYFSIATLPDNSVSTLDLFKDHAYAFITNSEVSWIYNESMSELTSTYTISTSVKEGTETQTLQALYRHQWLNCSETFTGDTYPSPRGEMKLFAGNSFNTEMTHHGILPGLPDELSGSAGYDQNQLADYIQELANTSIDQLIPYGDTYFHGKDLGKIAQVVRIAEQIGNTSARDYFLNSLKSRLENWLTASTGETSSLFYHNDNWGTLIGYPTSFGSDSQLNDHHFHWAYFIMAAATVAQYDQSWASESSWGGMVNMLIRDVAAWERDDPLFPFLRCYDIYAGHSWASGNGASADGNNQESSSESMNFSAATALWGAATGNDIIRDLGIFLYTNEMHAIEQYWFDVDEQVFPEEFDHNCLGIVWGTKGVHSTWFSGEPEMIHGINFLPVTAASLYLGRDPGYVLANYYEMVDENGGAENNWYDIMWEFLALADPDLAITKFNNYSDYPVEGGETRAHTYHWLHNLRSMGEVDLTVTANVPNYAVFLNGNVRTYVAYNPGNTRLTVQFSDGGSIEVAPGEMSSYNAIVDVPQDDPTIDFEPDGIGADWTWNVFENSWNPPLEFVGNPNPAEPNTSATVAKFTALDGGQNWAGCESSDIDPITFDSSNSTVRIMVYKPVVSDVMLKFENGGNSVEINAANTLTNQWEELVYDFSGSMGETFTKLVILPDFAPRDQDNIIYFDNISFSDQITGDGPTTAAPIPTEAQQDVISIYSDTFTDISGVNYDPDWGQSTIVTTENINGNEMMKYANLNYQGTDWNGNPQDVSGMDYLHVDFWTNSSTNLGIYLISGVYPSHTEVKYDFTLNNGNWVSVEIPLSEFTPVNLSDARQFKVEGDGDVCFDNLYFYGVSLSSDATLSDLQVDGTTIDGFSSEVYSYDRELPFGTTIVPTVTATTTDTNANHVVNDALALPGTTEVVVTAEDGTTQQTYSVNFTVASEDEPLEAAPTPTEPSENVISLFSNVYPNVTVDTWSAGWDQADVEDTQVAGDDVKLFTNLVYCGIEFISQTIDATEMDYFHLDIWTPDDTSAPSVFNVKLVDFGSNGIYGGGDDTEHEITFDENTMETGSWVSLDIPMSDFINLASTEHLAQLLLSGDPNTVYVDNVYFYEEISQPETPQNVTISIIANEVSIYWNPAVGANSYKVYSSDDPDEASENWILEEEGISGTTWSETILGEKKFYYVVASSDAPRLMISAENR